MRFSHAALLCGLVTGLPAFACSCASTGPSCPGLGGKAFPVFLGTVLSVTDVPDAGGINFLSRKARIRVDESFGGVPDDLKEVDVLTGMGGGDCGVPFQPGDIYLVAASANGDGLLSAGICSSTRKIEGSSAALDILRLQRDGKPIPSLAGRIARYDRSFDGDIGMHPSRALPNLTVRVQANGSVYETQSDGAGLYSFYSLPAGQYEFAPDLPPGTKLSWYINSDRPLAPFPVTAGGCQERDIEVFASGSIQGRILDERGQPLSYARVYIQAADQNLPSEEFKRYSASQTQESLYKFVHLPPGRYLLTVNPDDKQDPSFPYSRTYYPGVADRESARVLTIQNGEQIVDADIRLKPKFEPRRLAARVTWSDGRVIQDFVFLRATAISAPDVTAATRQPDLKRAEFDVQLHPRESYRIGAQLTCRYTDGRAFGPGATLRSNEVVVRPNDGLNEISLTIPAAACPSIPGKESLN